MDTLVVDGYNCLRNMADCPGLGSGDLEAARMGFVRSLEMHQQVSGDRVIVVFDGPAEACRGVSDPGPERERPAVRGVEVVYARGRDADAAIVDLIRSSCKAGLRARGLTRGGAWIVVTEDRELARRAARLGTRTMGHQAFSRRLSDAREAWGGPCVSPSGAGPSLFETLDPDSLDRLKRLRLELAARGSKPGGGSRGAGSS